MCPVLPETSKLRHNLPVPAFSNFPELSRKPALKTRTITIDPTLRDPMENGVEATSVRYTRRRRQFDVSIDMLTQDDYDELEDFVQTKAVFGSNVFLFPDNRNPRSPRMLQVKFSTLPAYTEVDNREDGVRQNCTFQLRER